MADDKQYISDNDPQLLTYNLTGDVVAFSTERAGGCSAGPYATFNANAYCGDNPDCVARNRRSLCRKLGLDDSALFIPHQVHGTKCVAVTPRLVHSSAEAQATAIDGVDALMTNLRRTCVAVSTADCVPILLYDSQNRAVAAVHSGWRGTQKRIVQAVIGEMTKTYNTNPAMLRAVIGPHIGMTAYEVGDDVYSAFDEAGFPMPKIADRRSGRWHLSLTQANLYLLQQAGVPSHSIYDSAVCCFTQNSRFFSARRDGIESGRTLTGIFLV